MQTRRWRAALYLALTLFPTLTLLLSLSLTLTLAPIIPNPDQVARRLFERVTALRLSSKKMKFFFKRYLAYARAAGDEELVEHVKEKARAWVESAAGQE